MALREVREGLAEDKRCPEVEPNSEAVPQGAGRGGEALLCLADSGNAQSS